MGKAPASKIHYIPHGFLLSEFENSNETIIHKIRTTYQIENKHPIIGVVSRFTHWKGVQYIIPAFKQILHKYPNAVLFLLNASGDYENEINALLAQLNTNNYRKIVFEPNISSAYKVMDLCVHAPIDEHSEAFGQVYIEALAAGVPLVATQSGIANNILVHQQNSWLVPHQDADAIKEGIIAILEKPDVKQQLIKNGLETVKSFSLQNMINQLTHLYENA